MSADAVVIGAGAGLSTAAGLTYSGERFETYFADFRQAYGITDQYSGGFYPFPSLEEYWAWWSRQIYVNRYLDAPKDTYARLFDLVRDRDYFVLTTNVDHCFQKAGFDKAQLFYTQGDYGLWQCSKPCHQKTYDNAREVFCMLREQRDRRIPTNRIPRCPVCGAPMAMNLRCDDTFVQDEGWYAAADRYTAFLRRHAKASVVFWELGVGCNTPGIIKYPFWRMTADNPRAVYACVNLTDATCPAEIRERAVGIEADIHAVLSDLSRQGR